LDLGGGFGVVRTGTVNRGIKAYRQVNKTSFHSPNFLDLPEDLTEFDKSEFVILPVPYEHTTTYWPGTKHGPSAIIAASQEVETFDEELKFEPCHAGICTLGQMKITTSGSEKMLDKIYRTQRLLLKRKKKVVMLGGEHTISIGAVRAQKKRYPRLSVLQMDAHADLRDSYQDSKFSHACVMRRIAEISHFVSVGIRNLSREEHRFIQKSKADVFPVQDLKESGGWTKKVLDRLGSDVYLTFDLDVLDPSIMPAVGTPEPGGLLWYETLSFLKELVNRKNLVGFDVVELCPIPGMIAPDFLAARLIYKIMGYMVQKGRKTQN
jgi:agmatinase